MIEAVFVYLFGACTLLDVLALIASIAVGDIGQSVWFAILSTLMILCSIFAIRDEAKAHKKTRLTIEIKDDAE